MRKNNQYISYPDEGSRSSIYRQARWLRQRSTEAEDKLWELLRNRGIKGKKFRRKHPLTHHILDFYCHECKLAIELDDIQNKTMEVTELDTLKTDFLNRRGITVLRFCNDEVMESPEKVLEIIAAQL